MMTLLRRFASVPWVRHGPWLLAGWLALVPGCATSSGKRSGPKFVFYPPAPETPRLQFLVSFSDEKDLGRKVSKFANFVTGEEPPSQPIVKPYGVLLASNQLYFCDTGTRSIGALDLVQKTMRRFAPVGLAALGLPICLAIDADGTRYVADTGRNQVMIYGADDSFQGAIGDDNTLRPTSVAVTTGRLYISDLKGHCVRVYQKEGRKQLFTIPRNPDAEEDKEPGKLYMPVNLALDRQGRVYVSDVAACRVHVYDAEGKYLRCIGSRGDLPGQFARPKGLAVDREDRIYVVDAASQVCQIFDTDGKLLLFFGEPNGSAASLDLPAAVAVDYEHVGLFERYAAPDFVVEHLVIITNQLGPRKISIYGLGHKR
ncbi:MAG: 6-bladed beta-propeller [Verrucomicrobiota bacterium]|jgi:sugar lactone lactonase YvrE